MLKHINHEQVERRGSGKIIKVQLDLQPTQYTMSLLINSTLVVNLSGRMSPRHRRGQVMSTVDQLADMMAKGEGFTRARHNLVIASQSFTKTSILLI